MHQHSYTAPCSRTQISTATALRPRNPKTNVSAHYRRKICSQTIGGYFGSCIVEQGRAAGGGVIKWQECKGKQQTTHLHLVQRSRMSGAVFVCSFERRAAFVQGRAVAGIWSRRPWLGNGVVRVEIIRWTYRHRGRIFSCRSTFDWCSVLIRDFVVDQFEASVWRMSICFPSSNKNFLGTGKLYFCFNSFLIGVLVGVTLAVKLSSEGGIIKVGVDFC